MVGPQWKFAATPIHLRMPLLLAVPFCSSSLFAFTIGENPYIEFSASSGSFPIAANGHASTIYVDANDDPGVVRAPQRFAGRHSSRDFVDAEHHAWRAHSRPMSS